VKSVWISGTEIYSNEWAGCSADWYSAVCVGYCFSVFGVKHEMLDCEGGSSNFQLLSFEKSQTSFRGIRVMFTFFPCVKHVLDNWRRHRLWNTAGNSVLNARNVLPSEIHHQICQVYCHNAMSDGMVRKCVRMYNEGREYVHDESWSGCPSLVNEDLARIFNHMFRSDRRFTISELFLQFPHISKTQIHETLSSTNHRRRPHSMRRVHKNLCPAAISASIMAAYMWKISLKNVGSNINKIL